MRPSLRALVNDLHMYATLACAPYLVLYGISSISFNHEWAPADEIVAPRIWQASISLPEGLDRFELARIVRDRLDLTGNLPGGSLGQSTADELQFEVRRPFALYRITWSRSTEIASVTESRRGILSGLQGLHGLTILQDNALGPLWASYSWYSIFALLFAVVTGIYLWWQRLPDRRLGWSLLALGSGGSLLFMLYFVI